MDYEKKLKETLVNGNADYEVTRWIEQTFPELKESEDEKIRKELLNAFRESEDSLYMVLTPHRRESFIAWLEKQGRDKEMNNFDVLPGLYKCVYRMFDGTPDGKLLFEVGNIYKCLSKHDRAEFEVSYGHSVYLEDPVVCKHFIPYEKQDEQKPADKIGPKFHEGEWITFTREDGTREVLQVSDIIDGRYYFNHLLQFSWSIKECDEKCHLWTIQDAKDGDVLVNGSNIFIFHFLNDTRLMGYCHVNIDNGRFYDDIGKNECFCLIDAVVNPATKEQCDLLFKKMHEAGYTIDFKKKELRKLKFKVGDEVITKNEESLIITRIDKEGYWSNDLFICGFDDSDEWELVEQRPEWGEEDKQNLNAVLSYINDEYLRRWLKDAIHKKYDKHTEWSEEDESMYTRTIGILGKCYMGQLPTKVEDELNWLKSLKSKL